MCATGKRAAAIGVDVYANQKLEASLTPTTVFPSTLSPPFGGRPRRPELPLPAALPPSPVDRLNALGGELIDALEFLASRLGPPPLANLNVTPIPGRFGQGFPGLIYLSTFNYLDAHRIARWAVL